MSGDNNRHFHTGNNICVPDIPQINISLYITVIEKIEQNLNKPLTAI